MKRLAVGTLIVIGFALFAVVCMCSGLTGCAITRVAYNPDGSVLSISHKRFIISEEFAVKTGSWSAECKSKPDEATMLMAKGVLDMAAQVAAKGVAP